MGRRNGFRWGVGKARLCVYAEEGVVVRISGIDDGCLGTPVSMSYTGRSGSIVLEY